MYRTTCFLFFTLLGGALSAAAQPGCPDPQALNHSAAATANNGSCRYAPTAYSLVHKATLPAVVHETSGLLVDGGALWTLNDGGNEPALYRLDTLAGQLQHTVRIANAANVDWEALAADEQYLYAGDFGNNAAGNRTDLVIYRVRRADLSAVSATADVIRFSYADQTDFRATPPNRTSFDCEAMLVRNGTVHLFTKDWIGGSSRHYTLPATPGTHQAVFQEELPAEGLVTDAAQTATGEIVLLGYTRTGSAFLWLLFDYPASAFFSGNKRRIELGLALSTGQVEGIAFGGHFDGYVSGEAFGGQPPVLHSFAVGQWVYYNPTATDTDLPDTTVEVHPQPASGQGAMQLTLRNIAQAGPFALAIADGAGRQVWRTTVTATAGQPIRVSLPPLAGGLYLLHIQSRRPRTLKLVVQP